MPASNGHLVRIRLARLHHANLVIGEYRRTAWHLHFRHMATYAVLILNRAMLLHVGLLVVTSQASPIVTSRLADQRSMRIMAGGAANSPVISLEAFAIG